MINRLTGTLDFQTQALTLRAERQRLIASNIANADTPGYVARDFDFAKALREAQGAPGTGRGFKLAENAGAATGGGDGDGSLTTSTRGAQEPRLRYAAPSQTNLDGNSVDMDRERASFVDNALKYESTLRFINGSVKHLMDAMKSQHQS